MTKREPQKSRHELGLRYEPYVERFEGKLPYVNFLFGRAQQIARHEYLCYANCDMLLMQDFQEVFEKAVRWRRDFLLFPRDGTPI